MKRNNQLRLGEEEGQKKENERRIGKRGVSSMTAEETLMKYRKVSLTCMKVLEVYEGF